MATEEAMKLTAAELQCRLAATPMTSFMGIKVFQWEPGARQLTCTMCSRPELGNEPGAPPFHGGAISALMDSVASFALIGLGLTRVPTLDIRTDFLRSPTDGDLHCTALVRHIGCGRALVDAYVTDAASQLVALGRCSFIVLDG